MLTCNSCKTLFPNVKDLITHIRKHCTHYLENSRCYRCGERECFKQFTSVDAFRRHLKSKHIVDAPSILEDLGEIISCNNAAEATPNNFLQDDVTLDTPSDLEKEEIPCTDTANKLVQNTTQFIASLYSNPTIPRSTVQTVVDGLTLFHENFSDTLRKQFQTHETIENDANAYSSLNGVLTTLKDCMLPFTSEYKRFKLFSSIGTYILPFEVVVCS